MCASPPSGSEELSKLICVWRYVWGSTPVWTKPMCACFLFSPLFFFFRVVASVFCLPSSCFSEWYGLVSVDRFCIIPNHLQIALSAVQVFQKQAASVWIQLCCVVPAQTGSEEICGRTWISAGQKYFFDKTTFFCYLVSDVSCFVEIQVLEQDNESFSQVIRVVELIDLCSASL